MTGVQTCALPILHHVLEFVPYQRVRPASEYTVGPFRESQAVAAAGPADPRPELSVDLVLSPPELDYALHRELGRLAPTGPGNEPPLLAVVGATVTRLRATAGGHTQLTLRRERDVLDAIAFGRDDLVGRLAEGDRIDVVGRLTSRTFGGFESLQLEIRDLATAGAAGLPVPAGSPVLAGGGLR